MISPENLSLSFSVLTAIFPGEPRLVGFTEAKDDGGGGDNWSYKSCKAPIKSSPLTNLQPTFYRPDALPVTLPNSVIALKGKYHIPWTCLPQAHLGVFQLCL